MYPAAFSIGHRCEISFAARMRAEGNVQFQHARKINMIKQSHLKLLKSILSLMDGGCAWALVATLGPPGVGVVGAGPPSLALIALSSCCRRDGEACIMFLKATGYFGPIAMSRWRAWPCSGWRLCRVVVDAEGEWRQETNRGSSRPSMSDSGEERRGRGREEEEMGNRGKEEEETTKTEEEGGGRQERKGLQVEHNGPGHVAKVFYCVSLGPAPAAPQALGELQSPRVQAAPLPLLAVRPPVLVHAGMGSVPLHC